MFLSSTFSSIEAEARRQALLDQAQHHRLVRLARAGTKASSTSARIDSTPCTAVPPGTDHRHPVASTSR
jgi:uncharacterized protein YfaQ (DUF2300 family)